MLSVVVASCLLVLCSSAVVDRWANVVPSESLHFEPLGFMAPEEKFREFKQTHGKVYESPNEEAIRFQIFADNLKKIKLHNYLHSKGLKSYTLGINKFADMEHSEFVQLMTGFKGQSNEARRGATFLSSNVKVDLPKEVDWRKHGYVTPVKNQGQCGSCWAFSSTGALEGQNFRKTKKLVSLSEQNLIDCSTKQGNQGCNGGIMDQAFDYIKINNGIDTEESYPYTEKDGVCHYNASTRGATDVGYVDIQKGNETQLMEAIATVGPVSVAIDAGQNSFQLYSSGVYDEPMCTDQLDHGVLAVGYGVEDGKDYWLVKNSWGETWGLNGYILMSRNKDNQCGIADMASYPLV
jgi:cathepsin L